MEAQQAPRRAEVSVDTYLRGKNTSGYTRLRQDDVEMLLSPRLLRWAKDVQLDVKSFLFKRTSRCTSSTDTPPPAVTEALFGRHPGRR